MWVALLVLPFRPWSTRERLEPTATGSPPDTSDLTVLIPARNEAKVISRSLEALRVQAPELRVVVVDDSSTDGTDEVARAVGLQALRIVSADPLPDGWTGKLWALDQGLQRVETDLVLLLDADIELEPGIIDALLAKRRERGPGLVSVMATLETETLTEKLTLPAFVYFFKLLYPFSLSNSSFRWVAAGAGGCMLVDTSVLREIGAFSSLRDEIIDDCAVAARIKAAGHRTWIGLSRGVQSRRSYGGLRGIWEMVARTAFTQLRYSVLVLALCVATLVWAFVLPVVGLIGGESLARVTSIVGLAAMVLSYLPTLRFYRLSPLWALLLPVTGALYMLMTVDSAIRYFRGVRSTWRGRIYATSGRES
jgi:hopene-associated glycosyltransferase HpnB